AMLYTSGAVNGSIRFVHPVATVSQKIPAPTTRVAIEIQSAGSSPCHSARWAGCSGTAIPVDDSGAVSAYGASTSSTNVTASPAMTPSDDSTTGAARNPIGGSGHSVLGRGVPAA